MQFHFVHLSTYILLLVLCFTLLHFTSNSPHFTSLNFFTSLHFTSLHFTSLHFTRLQNKIGKTCCRFKSHFIVFEMQAVNNFPTFFVSEPSQLTSDMITIALFRNILITAVYLKQRLARVSFRRLVKMIMVINSCCHKNTVFLLKSFSGDRFGFKRSPGRFHYQFEKILKVSPTRDTRLETLSITLICEWRELRCVPFMSISFFFRAPR